MSGENITGRSTRVVFTERGTPFPFARPILRNFLLRALAEGADQLRYYRPRRFNFDNWARRIEIAKSYYSDSESDFNELAKQFGIEGPNADTVARYEIKTFVEVLFLNSSQEVQEPLREYRKIRNSLPIRKL